MRVLLIGNPAAGAGGAARAAEALVACLVERGHEVERFVTRAPGDAARRAAACTPDLGCIVPVGGDGTIAEVLNGVPDPAAVPLVPLATGTANMLARALRLPRDPRRLADVIERGALRRIDCGLARLPARAAPLRFLSVAGVGFDAMVTERLARTRRGRLGYRGYVAPIAATLVGYRPPRLRVRLDDGPPRACAFAIVGRVANYGGVLRVTPDARPDDGWLHACLFERAAFPDLVRAVWPAVRGRLAGCAGVIAARARRIEVEAETPTPVQLDGDYRGTTPLALELAPGAVAVRVPACAGPGAASAGSAR